MASFSFRVGSTFEQDGTAFRIERLNGEDVILERLQDGKTVLSSMDELLKSYSEGRISALIKETTAPSPFSSLPLSMLTDTQRREVMRRRAYLKAMSDEGRVVFTRECLRPIIARTAIAISDKLPPSVTTLWRWHRRHRDFHDVRALVPRLHARGCRLHRQSPRVTELLTDAVNEAFAASPRATGGMIYARFATKIVTENLSRFGHEKLSTPNIRTVYRLLQRTEAYDQVVLREGKAEADRRFRIFKAGARTQNILERVEADHTPLDLFLIDEKTWLPLGRPTLTIYIDHYSRFPIGYYLSYGGTSATAVIGGLRHAILPKQPAAEVIPNLKVEHRWPCYGRPDSLVLDNGMEFLGWDLESVAMDLSIYLQFCPKRTPRFKGTIERYLKTVNYFFAHQIPGTSMARLQDRGDYDPQKHAVLTLAEFKQVFEKWLLDIYAQTRHRGIQTTPWAKWHEGAQRRVRELPGDLQTLKRRIGRVTERSLRADGINLKGLRYADDRLLPILKKWGIGTKVRVVYDAEDLGDIQVWAPEENDPVLVLAIDQDYARGLTLIQHQLIRRQTLENGKDIEDTEALRIAKNQIAVSLETLVCHRKLRTRRKAAAGHGITSENPEARLKPTVPASPPKSIKTAKSVRSAIASDAHLEDALPPSLAVFSLNSSGVAHAH
nr:Mu transposase C-terminal domain-containing protein [uncultured Albidiferax sp.]